MAHKAGLAPMRVCIYGREESVCEHLAGLSEIAGYKVEQIFREPRMLVDFISGSNVEHLVLINVDGQDEDRLRLIKQLNATGPRSIVALATEVNTALAAGAMEAGAQALLISPIEAKDICAAFTTATYQRSRQARLEDDSRGLRDKLAERKLIEKAKGILMESAKVTESEAFRFIRRQSQDKRMPMSEIATQIISATELVRSARASAE